MFFFIANILVNNLSFSGDHGRGTLYYPITFYRALISAGIVRWSLHVLTHLNCLTTIMRCYFYSHFIEEKTEHREAKLLAQGQTVRKW